MMRFLVMLPVLLMVAACGRVGPIAAPGPAGQVTHPRQYPAPERVRTPHAAAATAGASAGAAAQEPLAASR